MFEGQSGDGTPRQEAAQVRPLTEGLQDLKKALGEKASELLPDGKPVSEIVREDYTAKTYKGEEGPTHVYESGEAITDGHLYEVKFNTGEETYVIEQRRDDGNPFLNLVPLGGADLRPWATTYTYEWDGQNNIKATTPTGKVQNVSGEWGTPDKMLPTLRAALGQEGPKVVFASAPATPTPAVPSQ